jgi:predicted phosphodiesterase
MSFFPPQFQIMSDLHLETPLTTPQYGTFHLHPQADNVFLLGDIGLVVDAGLFDFLRRTLDQNRGCRIFYVLGNHEPYRTTYEHAHKLLRDFEQEAKQDFGGRFKFLCRDRYDVNETITILGCTLWSAIQPSQASDIASRSTDLHSERGIKNWTLDRHQEEHEKDLTWLNTQISSIETEEPRRQIMVVTHHSPTMDSRANDPRHEGSSVSSNFVTDLSQELCWRSPAVKLWAFGHTHYSCSFRDEGTGKLVVANQRRYAGLGAGRKRVGTKVRVVEAGKEEWEVVESRKSCEGEQVQGTDTQNKVVDDGEKEADASPPKVSLLHRMSRRIQGLHGSRRESS